MIFRIMIFRIAIGALTGCAVLCPGPAAYSQAPAAKAAAQAQTGEWSAAKKQRHVHHDRRPAYVYRVPRFGGADPSFNAYGRPYQRPAWGGSCVMDDGYGRFSACPNR